MLFNLLFNFLAFRCSLQLVHPSGTKTRHSALSFHLSTSKNGAVILYILQTSLFIIYLRMAFRRIKAYRTVAGIERGAEQSHSFSFLPYMSVCRLEQKKDRKTLTNFLVKSGIFTSYL